MNRKDIIRMIANLDPVSDAGLASQAIETLERFAALIAAAEREECAKLCDELAGHCWVNEDDGNAESCAKAIRARTSNEIPAKLATPMVRAERTYTRAQLLEAIRAERYACSIVVWMTLQDAISTDADDLGLDGWMREAERRVKNRHEEHDAAERSALAQVAQPDDAMASAIAVEREECAKLEHEAGIYTRHDLAEAIRARGKA